MRDSKVSDGLFLCQYLQDDKLFLVFVNELSAIFPAEQLFVRGCDEKTVSVYKRSSGFIEKAVCVSKLGDEWNRAAVLDLLQ